MTFAPGRNGGPPTNFRGEPQMPDLRSANSGSDDLFAGGGDMGALMRATDWSKTGLGPVETWPKSLKTMLGVLLGSRFPMLLWWGSDLLHLYNDAYRPILRDKHPESLGAPAARIWAEVWDIAGPMARSVQDGGPATWTEDLQLFINSGGMAEETYFTFSYSPVPGDDGKVGGILNTVQETTVKVQGERQIRMLHDIAARSAETKSEGEAHRAIVERLAENDLDLPFVLLYLVDAERGTAHLVASSGFDEGRAASPPIVPLTEGDSAMGWPLAEVGRAGRAAVVPDLAARFGRLPPGRFGAAPDRAIILPLLGASRTAPFGFLVAGQSPHRAYDERYQRFFNATAAQVSSALNSARANEAEKKRSAQLAELDRAKTTFFSNVSHEFRTPLTLILGPVEDALARTPSSLAGDDLASVHRSVVRLLRLVNGLLDYARVESGRLQMAFVPTDLSALTIEIANSFRSLVERAGLSLLVDCPPLQEPVYLDPVQWEKIVLNLVSNAFKFTLRGGIEVSLRACGDHVELCVRDTGSGVPAAELPRIFERFHRIEGARGRSFEGSGIGLALVHDLVKLHGGQVRATSREGEGSAFVVSLPMGRAHVPAEQLAEPASSAGPAASPYLVEASQWLASGPETWEAPLVSNPKASKPPLLPERPGHEHPRVLVADDNPDMRAYLTRLLSARYAVEAVENGELALAAARRHLPDLVLSDVMMPALDGFSLRRALRSDPRTVHVPVILLSARAGEEAVLEGLEAGADDYLIKPFRARELLARVETHLNLARLRREWASELERANHELEAFSYSVSHDLRAPLRTIDGFSKVLLDGYEDRLDDQGRHCLNRVRVAVRRMSQLIDDLLRLSRITRSNISRQVVDLTNVSLSILRDLKAHEPERAVDWEVAPGMVAEADARLVKVMLENLIANAWKFTSKVPTARIEVGQSDSDDGPVFFVRDNGAGFDMEHSTKIFTAFHRLHTQSEFEGTGIGLATVQRVVSRHGGRVWTEAAPGEGATFFFTLESDP
jgi:signal transduction histidine kinase